MKAIFTQTGSELPLVFGHRGYSSRAPENTMAAFELIREHQIPAVELDVHRCASGEIVVIHDNSLERTGGIDLPVDKSSLSDLREHEVGSWFDPQFAGEGIPLLDNVLDLLGSDHYLDIEIKPHDGVRGPAHPHSVEWEVVRLVRERGLVSHVVISSFDPRIVRRVHELAPEIRTAAIYIQAPEMPWFLRRGLGTRMGRASATKPHWEQVTARLVAVARRRDTPVVTWTVDDPVQAIRLARLGVHGIVSNTSGEIASALTVSES